MILLAILDLDEQLEIVLLLIWSFDSYLSNLLANYRYSAFKFYISWNSSISLSS